MQSWVRRHLILGLLCFMSRLPQQPPPQGSSQGVPEGPPACAQQPGDRKLMASLDSAGHRLGCCGPLLWRTDPKHKRDKSFPRGGLEPGFAQGQRQAGASPAVGGLVPPALAPGPGSSVLGPWVASGPGLVPRLWGQLWGVAVVGLSILTARPFM